MSRWVWLQVVLTAKKPGRCQNRGGTIFRWNRVSLQTQYKKFYLGKIIEELFIYFVVWYIVLINAYFTLKVYNDNYELLCFNIIKFSNIFCCRWMKLIVCTLLKRSLLSFYSNNNKQKVKKLKNVNFNIFSTKVNKQIAMVEISKWMFTPKICCSLTSSDKFTKQRREK